MDSREFTDWMAYRAIEPDPAEVSVQLLSLLTARIFNVYRDPKDPAYLPADFLPGGDRAARLAQTSAQSMAVMAQFAANRKKPD